VVRLVVACLLEPVTAVVENGSVVELLVEPLVEEASVLWELVS